MECPAQPSLSSMVVDAASRIPFVNEQTLVTLSLVGFVLLLLIPKTQASSYQKLYQKWIDKARKERDEKKHHVLEKKLDHKDVSDLEPVLEWSALQVRQAVVEQKLDLPTYVTYLAQDRCRKIGRKEHGINAIAEEMYDSAYALAEKYKASVKKKNITKSNMPPLFGVPISIKECLTVKGMLTTGGLACRLNKRASEDSLTVKVLRQSGAIPMCTGNVPQLLMMFESFNNFWDLTRNPWNLKRSSGGSSGGEAALVASRCVQMAIGNDVGGSVRGPACFNGLVGFKPSATRSTLLGSMRPRYKERSYTSLMIPSVVGPLTRSVEDAAQFLRAYWVPELFHGDKNVAPMTFDENAYSAKEKLKIGYFETDNWFEPCRTSKRAVRETIEKMEKAGHTCVPFKLPRDGWFYYGLFAGIQGAEGNAKSYREALEGEAFWDQYHPLVMASSIPESIKWLLTTFFIDKRRGHVLKQMRTGGVKAWELGEIMADLEGFRAEFSKAMVDSEVDALIFPGFPVPAVRHFTSGELTSSCSYMFLANLLRWPSGVVPVTLVQDGEAVYPMDELPKDQRDKIARLVASNMEGSEGMPMGISVMTPIYRDEDCLRVMKEVERVVGFSESPSAYKDA